MTTTIRVKLREIPGQQQIAMIMVCQVYGLWLNAPVGLVISLVGELDPLPGIARFSNM